MSTNWNIIGLITLTHNYHCIIKSLVHLFVLDLYPALYRSRNDPCDVEIQSRSRQFSDSIPDGSW